MATVRGTTRSPEPLARAIKEGAAFRSSGALSATPGPVHYSGVLPDEFRASFQSAMLGPAPYVVISYSTPIAWTADGLTWLVPSTKYSVTTSKHQSTTRQALRMVGRLVSAL